LFDEGQHGVCVDTWIERSAENLPPERLLQLFDAAFFALWARTRITLGEVTLTAIADRVLYNASEKFPFFSSLEVDPTAGIQCRELGERIGSIQSPELIDGLRFILVELLTVLGSLTAETLTPELHSALSQVALPGAPGEGKRS
jgi:hypothetical protein